MYRLKFLKKAQEELSKIDPVWQRRIKAKLEILAENPAVLKNQINALKGKIKGLAWLQVGPYKNIFQKQEKVMIILIVRISHRRDIYRR